MTNDNQELKKKMAEIAKINLNDKYLGALAAAYQGKSTDRYGTILTGLYDTVTEDAPNQNTWNNVFKDEVQSEDGVLTRPIIMKKAAKVVQESVVSSEVADVIKRMGVKKGLSSDYDGKYVSDLKDEQVKGVVTAYVNSSTNAFAVMALEGENAELAGGLEKMFCEAA